MSNLTTASAGTDVYLMLGDSAEQSLITDMFNPIFSGTGIDARLVPVSGVPENLGPWVKNALAAANTKGFWVAHAHQSAVINLLDHCSSLGRVAGGVNVIRRNQDGKLEGALFDGVGFVASLIYFGISYADKRVLILGAGGAAAAIAASLARPEDTVCAAEIAIYDVSSAQSAKVAQRIALATGTPVVAATCNDPAGFDLVVNASPLGLAPDDPLPCDVSRMQAHACVLDLVMQNQPTALLRAARARGLQAQPGFEMLVQQAHLFLDFFGFSQAAGMLRRDASVLRQQIYPLALQHEIHPQLPSESEFSPFTFSTLP
jgi:shikimate dehydrogenase